MSAEPPARRLDLTGLNCPLPALKTEKALRALPAGTRLDVVCTDPMAAIDIPHFLVRNGHRLLAVTREGDQLLFRIEAGRPRPDDADA